MQGLETFDLFATKGVEYLAVMGFLVLLAAFWRILSSPGARGAGATAVAAAVRRVGGWFRLPEEYYYHQGHAWAAPREGDLVTVGMDDFAGKLLGVPDALELPPIGSRVRMGERAWTVRAESEGVRMVSPVDGEVVEVNPDVLRSPDLVTRDPYESGWLMRIRTPDPRSVTRNLLSGELAVEWMREASEHLREMSAGELGVMLTDGGVPVSGFARYLAPDAWVAAAEKLLLSNGEDGP